MTLLTMYMSLSGNVQNKTRLNVPFAPAGKIRVLCVLVRYPETITDDALPMWEAAQRHINEQHAAFGRSRGYKAPIVVFTNTNLVIDRGEIDGPRRPASVRAAAQRHGVSADGYQIVMTIDINPKERAGWLSRLDEKSVYVGNDAPWHTPLDAPMWMGIARTVYHLEIAQQWGWAQDWVVGCGSGRVLKYAPFIAPPVLFGWEDLQGEHVPEILSAAPYGSH
jgi:hypothetical protein